MAPWWEVALCVWDAGGIEETSLGRAGEGRGWARQAVSCDSHFSNVSLTCEPLEGGGSNVMMRSAIF